VHHTDPDTDSVGDKNASATGNADVGETYQDFTRKNGYPDGGIHLFTLCNEVTMIERILSKAQSRAILAMVLLKPSPLTVRRQRGENG